ncbi:Crp/Fnr family transcriptional regulator [Mesorhizobium sp. B2-5-9]|uniref:Crp/Fnr family transcriptional regulator n=1 Tax=unclassified Mesorhizobium TaxID=325217 RepID=UPI0011286059|nr:MULTISPECIES: Crp/Fnr family transcriptional regulator [unclassified Mesorhizobium]MBZ9974337.1 Crp/Fnr family transcriptional regulator [Mesorhizobium sp. BR-1-1-10]TPK03176.1 Crp/Fnr family transcriptional regulator [Mesorhizobium sp. B2-5-9]TPK10177.1 Crp/Fnr family transcriptional regulator [Mesorhizobium sp. B2-5-7]TPK85519.1 Crp/Fnr family transcriptional regulator [Mesorhizobium sp. B2-4-13]
MANASRSFSRGDEHRSTYVGLSDDDAALIKTLGFTAKRYPADAVIFSQSDNKDRIYVVESGWGCISHELPDGQRQILDFALTGDVVLPQSHGSGSIETFVARTELSLLVAPTKTLTLAAMKSPQLFSFIVGAFVRNGAVMAQHLANIGRRNALERTAHLLLELTARLQRVGAVDRNGFDCPLTQYDLADALGLTPIHVNRMLRELRERKFLEFRQGHVRVLDSPGLTKFAGFDGEYIRS